MARNFVDVEPTLGDHVKGIRRRAIILFTARKKQPDAHKFKDDSEVETVETQRAHGLMLIGTGKTRPLIR